ncbi:uncharacterized protein F5147DRAFT_656414 [Suillus discolor]|uniref:Isopenicillin N synthase-like Fe(2+) 2OG dioxygenase domain-containing protein n=1 Tax=Suillus discolor TaxID=1912936 RepID=A0A9P7EYK7_9AGAM|nr:uncharacterized protein F5147DRAFT_656414 [Suillus discolor]KAG2097282.1 hypothetical protein F5147DRAFT_656414 [Suillus discolor]
MHYVPMVIPKLRIFDIAGVPFDDVSPEEKIYTASIEKKVNSDNENFDQIENYAVNLDVTRRPHPIALRLFLLELDDFVRHNHFNILHPILRRSNEEEEKLQSVWLKGHTDTGGITILWSQPIGGLQIKAPDGTYYKHTIHRVIQPPSDQRAYDRLGVYYFSMPDNDVRLLPCFESPVLKRVRIERKFLDEDAPLSKTWRKRRMKAYGRRTDLKKGVEFDVEEEVIEGIVVKHYN